MDGMESRWAVDGTEDGTEDRVEFGGDMDEVETCRARDAICCESWANIATDCCW